MKIAIGKGYLILTVEEVEKLSKLTHTELTAYCARIAHHVRNFEDELED